MYTEFLQVAKHKSRISGTCPKSLCGAKHRFQNFWNVHRISGGGETHNSRIFLERVHFTVWRQTSNTDSRILGWGETQIPEFLERVQISVWRPTPIPEFQQCTQTFCLGVKRKFQNFWNVLKSLCGAAKTYSRISGIEKMSCC